MCWTYFGSHPKKPTIRAACLNQKPGSEVEKGPGFFFWEMGLANMPACGAQAKQPIGGAGTAISTFASDSGRFEARVDDEVDEVGG